MTRKLIIFLALIFTKLICAENFLNIQFKPNEELIWQNPITFLDNEILIIIRCSDEDYTKVFSYKDGVLNEIAKIDRFWAWNLFYAERKGETLNIMISGTDVEKEKGVLILFKINPNKKYEVIWKYNIENESDIDIDKEKKIWIQYGQKGSIAKEDIVECKIGKINENKPYLSIISTIKISGKYPMDFASADGIYQCYLFDFGKPYIGILHLGNLYLYPNPQDKILRKIVPEKGYGAFFKWLEKNKALIIADFKAESFSLYFPLENKDFLSNGGEMKPNYLINKKDIGLTSNINEIEIKIKESKSGEVIIYDRENIKFLNLKKDGYSLTRSYNFKDKLIHSISEDGKYLILQDKENAKADLKLERTASFQILSIN